ncbi:MAG: fibronectin type III domain-containing protein [Treponema sp.]
MKKVKVLCVLILVMFSFLACDNSPKIRKRLSPPTIKVCKVKSPTTVFLSWTGVPDADWYYITYYNFTENDGKGYIANSPVYGTSCTVSDLEPNTNYGFKVTAQSENPNFRESYGSEIKEVTTPRD